MPPTPELLIARKQFNKGIIVEDHLTLVPKEQTLASSTSIIGVDSAFRRISSSSDVGLSAPQIAPGESVGQQILLFNAGAGTITVSDLNFTAGSLFSLNSSTVALQTGDTLHVTWDGSNWVELSRSTSATSATHEEGTVNVRDYGAIGDGITDDYAAFVLAIAAVDSTGAGRLFIPPGTYLLNSGLTINTSARIEGSGIDYCVLKSGASMTAVMSLLSSPTVENLTFDGNYLATYACRSSGSLVRASFRKCKFTHAKNDGFFLPLTGLNDGNSFESCDFVSNGTIYRTSGRGSMAGYSAIDTVTTGTVATNSTTTLTGTGTAFNSMGIRRGDFIAVGVSPLVEYLQIKSVDSDTQLTLENTSSSTLTRSGQEFAIGIGDGFHESYGGADVNLTKFRNGFARSNAGCGAVFGGASGPNIDGFQVDTHFFYAFAVGHWQLATNYNSAFRDVYIEGVEAGGFFLGSAHGIVIAGVKEQGLGAPATNGQVAITPPKLRYSHGYAKGVWLGASQVTHTSGTQVDPIGDAYTALPVMSTVVGTTFEVGGVIRLVAEGVDAVAGTTLTPTGAHQYVRLAGTTVLTSTPTIATAGHVYGDVVVVHNASVSNLTLQDEGTLGSSALVLGKSKLLLRPYQSAGFFFGNDSKWHLVFTDGVLFSVASSTGVAGAATLHAKSGKSKAKATESTLVITNNLVTGSGTRCFFSCERIDSAATNISVACTANTITFTANAAWNADTIINWRIEDEGA